MPIPSRSVTNGDTSTLDSGAMSGNCAKASIDTGSVAIVAESVAASSSQSFCKRPPTTKPSHELTSGVNVTRPKTASTES